MLAEAAARGLRLLLALTNYWADYGGMRQYVAWACQARGQQVRCGWVGGRLMGAWFDGSGAGQHGGRASAAAPRAAQAGKARDQHRQTCT